MKLKETISMTLICMLLTVYSGVNTVSATNNVGDSVFLLDASEYVVLSAEATGEGDNKYLIMPKANCGAGVGDITYTDADGMMYKGKKLDEYTDNYAKFKPYMVRNVWNMDEGKTMTSYMCLPSTGEINGNADALAVMSSQSGSWAYGTDMTVTRQFYKQGDNMFLYRYSGKANPKADVTRLSNTDGMLANTQTLALNFAFYVTEDFFRNVKCDISTMSDTVIACVNASKATDAELEAIYGEIGAENLRSVKAYEMSEVIDKSSGLKVTMNFKNNTLENLSDMRMITAAYSEEGMTDTAISSNGIKANNSGTMETQVGTDGAVYAKVFLWYGMDNMIPVCWTGYIALK